VNDDGKYFGTDDWLYDRGRDPMRRDEQWVPFERLRWWAMPTPSSQDAGCRFAHKTEPEFAFDLFAVLVTLPALDSAWRLRAASPASEDSVARLHSARAYVSAQTTGIKAAIYIKSPCQVEALSGR
jgi:hypothetical protein